LPPCYLIADLADNLHNKKDLAISSNPAGTKQYPMATLQGLRNVFEPGALGKNHRLLVAVKWIAIVLVVLSFAKTLQNAPSNFDIELWDETNYLSDGISKTRPLFADYEDSGLYSAFYRVLSIFISDPVDLYLYEANVIVFLTFLAVFACLAVLSRSYVFSSLALGILLLSPAPTVWPRVSLAAIIILALTLMAATAPRKTSACFAILMLGAFLVSFVRPEFVLAFYTMAAAAAVAFSYEIWHSRSETMPGKKPLLYLSIAAVLLLSWVGPSQRCPRASALSALLGNTSLCAL